MYICFVLFVFISLLKLLCVLRDLFCLLIYRFLSF